MNMMKWLLAFGVLLYGLGAGPAAAVSLSFSGGVATTLPSNFSLGGSPAGNVGDSIVYCTGTTFVGCGLSVSGPADVTYTYLGSEAGNENRSFDIEGLQFDNNTTLVGATQTVVDGPGLLDFEFLTDGATTGGLPGAISNFGTATEDGLFLAFRMVSPDSGVVLFGDGAGDQDFDDMAIGVSVQPTSAVPVPAALPLLLTGLAGFALYRRRRGAA